MIMGKKKIEDLEKDLAKSIQRIDQLEDMLVVGKEDSLVDDIHYVIQINKKQQAFMNKQQNQLQQIKADYGDLYNFCKDINVLDQFHQRQEDKYKAQQKAMEELQKQNQAKLMQKDGKPDGKEDNKEEEVGSPTDQ
jgi:hypothetical protein